MKKILPLLIMAVIVSCAAPKYYSCPKSVNIVFNADSLPPCTHGLPNCKCLRLALAKTDTVPEWMHVSMRPKAYVVAQMALSVRVDGICTQHLDCAGKPFPVHYRVGWCQGKDELFNRLVKERRTK